MKIGRLEINWHKKPKPYNAKAAWNLAEQACSEFGLLNHRIDCLEQTRICDKTVPDIVFSHEIAIRELVEQNKKLVDLVEKLGDK